MSKDNKLSEQMNEVLIRKVKEYDATPIGTKESMLAGSSLTKFAEAANKVNEQSENKKERKNKIVTALIGLGGLVAGAVIKALGDEIINRRQLEFYDASERRAYKHESGGHIEQLITSPTSRDALKKKPRLK